MSDSFERLLDTSAVWLAALTWLASQLSASDMGRRIEAGLKRRLKWLKDPQGEKAFHAAFDDAIDNYRAQRGAQPAAQAVAEVLAHVANHDTSRLDRAVILDQVFSARPDPALLADVVQRHAVPLDGTKVSVQDASAELRTLILHYLRPSLQKQPFFTDRVGFAEVQRLLEQIRVSIEKPEVDLQGQREEYLAKLVQKYEFITMHGISPKARDGTRTIGIRMQDVFVPLKAVPDLQSALEWANRLVTALSAAVPVAAFARSLATLAIEHLELTKAAITSECLSESLRAARVERGTSGGPVCEAADSFAWLAPPLWLHGREASKGAGSALVEVPTLESEKSLAFSWAAAASTAQLRKAAEALRGPSTCGGSGIMRPVDIEAVLRFPKLVVRGDPGAGKSTLTRYVTWAVARGKTEFIGEEPSKRLPILIRAIQFGQALDEGKVENLEEHLVEDAGRFAGLVKQAVAAGSALILIDGLDEVGRPDLRALVREKVDDFAADPAFSDNQILITTRIVGYERTGLTGTFMHFTLCDLTDDQIESFAKSWCEVVQNEIPTAIDAASESQELLKAITANDSVHRMARNPLLLTIIALMKWQNRTLPDQRVLLYDAATQTLIRTWPLTQGRPELNELFVREWLAPVALRVLEDPTSDLIDEYSLMDELQKSMLRLKVMTPFEARSDSAALLEDVSLHSGIILPRGTDEDGRTVYGFLLQTFAEYMTAYYLAGLWEAGELDVLRYAHDPYWHEVVLLIAGHLGIQGRNKAGRFIHDVRELKSSSFESYIQRDLLLAGRILGDGVPVGPADLIRQLLKELLSLWRNTRITPQRHDAEEVLADLRGTEYAPVVARLARESGLAPAEAVQLAALLGPDHFSEQLKAVLDSDDILLRLRAARQLAKLGEPEALPVLVDLLQADDTVVRSAATETLAEADTAMTTEALSHLLDAEDPRTRLKAARLIATRGNRAGIDVLVKLLYAPDVQLRHQVWFELHRLHSPAVEEALFPLLQAEDTDLRLEAARLLARVGVAEAIKALTLLLRADSPAIRYGAAEVLAQREDPEALPVLQQLLRAEDIELRLGAAETLLRYGDTEAADRVVDVLVDYLGADDAELQYRAASLLEQRQDPRAIGVLGELLAVPDPALRFRAAKLLSRRDDEAAIVTLVHLGAHSGFPLRQQALETLRSKEHRALAAILRKLLANDDVLVRYVAASLLSERHDVAASDTLQSLLSSDDPWLRTRAALQLATRDNPAAVAVLVETLTADDVGMRVLAAEKLAEPHGTYAFEAMLRHVGHMLTDTAVPAKDSPYFEAIPSIAGSVADAAYRFLNRYLTPRGELEPPGVWA